ncbi:hypothetical protein ACFL2E_07045 [Thermodesulfobacteriota bacterium]
MVKRQKKNTRKNRIRKGFCKNQTRTRGINASTPFETCTEQLSPFGGLLTLIKFFDLVNFHKIFDSAYQPTSREPRLGHYSMMVGILMLLFIGFNRIWHFVYIRLDAMLCGFFNVIRLPAASTFWRYVDNLGINQAKSLLNVMSILRKGVTVDGNEAAKFIAHSVQDSGNKINYTACIQLINSLAVTVAIPELISDMA